MGWKRGLGVGLLFVGAFIILTGKVITGAVIGIGEESYLGLLGLLVFIIGVFLVVISRVGGLEKELGGEEIRVYDSEKLGVSKEERYSMKDPYRFFAESGEVSLRDFKRIYENIKTKEGEKYLERVREVYGEGISSFIGAGLGEEKEIGKEFLKVLYDGKVKRPSKRVA